MRYIGDTTSEPVIPCVDSFNSFTIGDTVDISTIVLVCIVAVIAIICGYVIMVRRSGATPLHLAAADDEMETAISLLASGADTNKKDKWGRTPLFQAIVSGSPKFVDLLLEFGADPNIVDHNGEVSLHHVSSRREAYGTDEILSKLFRHGANPDIRNNNGETPHDRSMRLFRIDIGDAILQESQRHMTNTTS